jgi:phage-related protein (TIGR01555 family)
VGEVSLPSFFDFFKAEKREEPPKRRRSVFSTDAIDDAPSFSLRDTLRRLQGKAPVPANRGTFDDSEGNLRDFKAYQFNGGEPNESLAQWYAMQSFIGHQMCAILAQNWLINKACSRPAEDSLRHWFNIVSLDGEEIGEEILADLRRADKKYALHKKLLQFIRKGRIFGLMIGIFCVESDDPDYYKNPFNPDGIGEGSYKGIALVEPYWCMPQLDMSAVSSPESLDFYTPQWWEINGKLYHRSHLCVFTGDEVADIYKPVYMYGGISVPQKIYERVYASERTANEAPALAMSKRTTILKTDAEKAYANKEEFDRNLRTWSRYRDNFGVKVADFEHEDITQLDTTLTDFDTVMMSQFQLVAAASDVPATKLLGTSPKGFNATGEYEQRSYHELLESIQEHFATPFVEKHHLCVMYSEIWPKYGEAFQTGVAWHPVDAPTSKEYAEIRRMDAETDIMLSEAGVVEAREIRQKILADEDSGFSNLDETPGDDLDAWNEKLQEVMQGTTDEDEWITVHPNGGDATGAHVLIGENGEIKAGMGGKFTGQKIGEIRKDFVGPGSHEANPKGQKIPKGLGPIDMGIGERMKADRIKREAERRKAGEAWREEFFAKRAKESEEQSNQSVQPSKLENEPEQPKTQKIPEGHERLSEPLKILKETEKAYGVETPGYKEAKETARYDIKELTYKQRELLKDGYPITWIPKSNANAEDGKIVSVPDWIAKRGGFSTKKENSGHQESGNSGNASPPASSSSLTKKPEKPVPPEWHGGGYWNGKVYAGNRVYIDNQEKKLSDEQLKELRTYESAKATYARVVKEEIRSAPKTYLNVRYADKEEAKRLGAKWDSEAKKWYHDERNGEMPEGLKKFTTAKRSTSASSSPALSGAVKEAQPQVNVNELTDLDKIGTLIGELQKKRKVYNNVVNEGGEGYNPYDAKLDEAQRRYSELRWGPPKAEEHHWAYSEAAVKRALMGEDSASFAMDEDDPDNYSEFLSEDDDELMQE